MFFIHSFIYSLDSLMLHEEHKYVGKVKSALFIKHTIVHLTYTSPLRTHIYHPSFALKC